jgi:hypothetical protein
MSRVPALPFRVFVQQKAAQASHTLPPLQVHSFANLATANICRDEQLKRPNVRFVTVAVVIDEVTAQSQASALETLDAQRKANAARVASRLTRI